MKTYNILSTFRIIKNSAFLQMKSNAVSIYFIATAFIQPVIFTLISVGTYVYGKKPDFGLFAITGTGLISIWNSNLFTSGEIINNERRTGTLSLIMATPTSLMLILLGKSFANALTSAFAMGITFLTGMIAYRLPIGIADPLNFAISLLLIIFSITCLGLVFGSLFILSRNAGEFTSVANYPVYLLSLSQLLTPTWGNIVLNEAATHTHADLLPNYLIIIGLSIIYLIIARVLYKKVEYLALEAGTLERW